MVLHFVRHCKKICISRPNLEEKKKKKYDFQNTTNTNTKDLVQNFIGCQE